MVGVACKRKEDSFLSRSFEGMKSTLVAASAASGALKYGREINYAEWHVLADYLNDKHCRDDYEFVQSSVNDIFCSLVLSLAIEHEIELVSLAATEETILQRAHLKDLILSLNQNKYESYPYVLNKGVLLDKERFPALSEYDVSNLSEFHNREGSILNGFHKSYALKKALAKDESNKVLQKKLLDEINRKYAQTLFLCADRCTKLRIREYLPSQMLRKASNSCAIQADAAGMKCLPMEYQMRAKWHPQTVHHYLPSLRSWVPWVTQLKDRVGNIRLGRSTYCLGILLSLVPVGAAIAKSKR